MPRKHTTLHPSSSRPTEQEIMLKQYGGLYIRYSTRKNGSVILEKGTPKNFCWLLLDQNNGNPELGHGYLWAFTNKSAAEKQLSRHLLHPNYTKVCGPYHRSHVSRDFLVMARFDFEKRFYKSYIKHLQTPKKKKQEIERPNNQMDNDNNAAGQEHTKHCRCGYNGIGVHPCHGGNMSCTKPGKRRFYNLGFGGDAGSMFKLQGYETRACDDCWKRYEDSMMTLCNIIKHQPTRN